MKKLQGFDIYRTQQPLHHLKTCECTKHWLHTQLFIVPVGMFKIARALAQARAFKDIFEALFALVIFDSIKH